MAWVDGVHLHKHHRCSPFFHHLLVLYHFLCQDTWVRGVRSKSIYIHIPLGVSGGAGPSEPQCFVLSGAFAAPAMGLLVVGTVGYPLLREPTTRVVPCFSHLTSPHLYHSLVVAIPQMEATTTGIDSWSCIHTHTHTYSFFSTVMDNLSLVHPPPRLHVTRHSSHLISSSA